MDSRFAIDDAVVVAICTGTHDFVVVDHSTRHPGDSAVTGLTFVTGTNVAVTFTTSNSAIVT